LGLLPLHTQLPFSQIWRASQAFPQPPQFFASPPVKVHPVPGQKASPGGHCVPASTGVGVGPPELLELPVVPPASIGAPPSVDPLRPIF
jgi:hypothetical protein